MGLSDEIGPCRGARDAVVEVGPTQYQKAVTWLHWPTIIIFHMSLAEDGGCSDSLWTEAASSSSSFSISSGSIA